MAAACLSLVFGTTPVQEDTLTVVDLGLVSGFQDYWGNHYRKGRSIVAEDFDGDGRVDYFIGNPGDESFIFRNLGPGPDGGVRFIPDPVLFRGELAFVASGSDYDDDGDLDLFIGCGGLDGSCLDFLLRNDSTPGHISFTDVSYQAGILGPKPAGDPLETATAGGAWGDYDRDGDPDLFVSVRDVDPSAIAYRSILWRNDGNGFFTDVTIRSNLDYWAYESTDPGRVLVDWGQFQNSTWLDADNDGDLDLFLNNALGPNVLWKNLLVEENNPRFVNATEAFSLPGEDLRYPIRSFASAVADFNNDGWQDLILFAVHKEPFHSPYGNGNGLFLNRQGHGFFNASSLAGINVAGGGLEVAMGCQVADLNADGIPDLAIGAGNPTGGGRNRLLLSTGMSGEIPLFEDASALIDFEPLHGIDPASPPYPEIPPYPYRTHGIAAADVDGCGHLELAVTNGAMAVDLPIAREPNRLFRFSGPGLGSTFRALLKGNGVTDSRDAIGARAYVEIPSPTGKRRVYQTVVGGSGFSAQNERTLTFGLGSDTTVSRLGILWPSGCVQVMEAPVGGGSSPLVVEQVCGACPGASSVEAWLDPDAYGCSLPATCRVEGTIEDAFGPVPWARVIHERAYSPHLSIENRSDVNGSFAVEHPYEPGLCETSVLEPFGYLPVSNPVVVHESRPGVGTLNLDLQRGPEAFWPRGVGYWLHQIRALDLRRGHAHVGMAEMQSRLEAIQIRYPGLGGFESLGELAEMFRPSSPGFPADRLRRQLAATMLNLASDRLSSFTVLTTGERVGNLVEEAYRWLTAPGIDASTARSLADRLELLNEGLIFPEE